jgi:O-antigen/teichoic acid export membrane protein
VNTFHSLSDKIQSDGVIFLITYKFSFAILGFYSMAIRAITTPAGMVGSAVGQVVFSKYSKIYNKTQDIEYEVLSIIKKLFIYATPLFIIIFFILPPFFSLVFGEEWEEAGIYAQILLPYIYLNFIVSPVSNVPFIVKKVKQYFTVSLTGNLLSVTAFAITVFVSNDFIISLTVFSLTRVLYTLFLLRWIVKISKKEKN